MQGVFLENESQH